MRRRQTSEKLKQPGGRTEAARSTKASAPPPRWWRARTPPPRSAKWPKPWPAWATPITLSPQLNRFEDTVSKEEATAKAFDQLASTGKDDDLEAQFAALSGHGVDAELAALKAERQAAEAPTPPPYIPKELASGSPSITTGAPAGEKAKA